MEFEEKMKLDVLKSKCKESIQEGTEWAEFKAEFLTFPASFRTETIDNLKEEKERMETHKFELETSIDGLDLLIEELEET